MKVKYHALMAGAEKRPKASHFKKADIVELMEMYGVREEKNIKKLVDN